MPLSTDLHEFIESVDSNAVDYLIVGAFAVAHDGYPRYTGDLDIQVRPEPKNITRSLRALEGFGFGSLGIQEQDFYGPGRIVQLGLPPNRIGLITSISEVPWEEAFESGTPGELDERPVRFLGLGALIRNKQSTGRLKDLADVEELKNRAEN